MFWRKQFFTQYSASSNDYFDFQGTKNNSRMYPEYQRLFMSGFQFWSSLYEDLLAPKHPTTREKKPLLPRVTWCPCTRALHHFTSWPAVINSSVITDHYLHSFIIWCRHQLAGILWKGDTVNPTRVTSVRTQAGFTDGIPQLAEKTKQNKKQCITHGPPGLTWSQHHKKLANTVQR